MRSFPLIFISYALAMAGIFTCIVFFSADDWWQLKTQLVDWDAEHYNAIRECGYDDLTQAFFPLFPFLWRWSGLGTYGICLLNLAIFGGGLWALWREFQWNTRWLPLYLATPMLMFMALPYTEATFFLFSAVLLIGLHRHNLWLTCAAILLCSLTRPTYTILLPALFLVEWLTEANGRTLLLRCALYTLCAGISTAAVLLLQHADTGEWFGYIDAQKYWGHRFGIPRLPLFSWKSGTPLLTDIILRTDASGILFGAISLISLSAVGLQRLRHGVSLLSRPLICSLLYCVGICASMLLFKGGSVNSVARYVFGSVFFLVMAQHVWENWRLSAGQITLLFVAILAFFLLAFGGHSHIRLAGRHAIAAAYWVIAALVVSKPAWLRRLSYAAFLLLNVALTQYFYWSFLHHYWIE
jgi:hypothetical protein